MKYILLFISSVVLVSGCAKTKTIIYPAPDGIEASKDYTVKINNQPLFVYQARVSAAPINQIWPGYQRPLEQTETASFCYFDTNRMVDVEIESKKTIEKVTVRPVSKNIQPEIMGNKIRFRVNEPCQLVVEVNDHHHALHLFVNPIDDRKKSQDQYTWYFGPGRHQPGIIELKDNESMYVEGGAVVETLIKANNAQNITIQGRGIIDASTFERGKGSMIRLHECTGVLIEGVILEDSPEWTLAMFESKNVAIDNVKLIGHWRYNSDGIDIVNSQDVTVNNCFIRAFDDCIALKGVKWTKNQSSISNVSANNCVIWCDWGKAIEIGVETVADAIHQCVFRNCDIIRYHNIALSIHCGDRASIFDIHYENIRVEEPLVENSYFDNAQNPIRDLSKSGNYGATEMSKIYLGRIFAMIIDANFYSQDSSRGKIFNIRFQNIQTHSDYFTKSTFDGFDENHDISDLLFENIYINGKKVTNQEEWIRTNEFVRNIVFQ